MTKSSPLWLKLCAKPFTAVPLGVRVVVHQSMWVVIMKTATQGEAICHYMHTYAGLTNLHCSKSETAAGMAASCLVTGTRSARYGLDSGSKPSSLSSQTGLMLRGVE